MIVYSMIHTVIIERAVWAPSVAARCGRPAWPRGVGAQRGRAVGAQRGRAVSAQRGGVGGRAVWAPSVAARCGRPGWPRGVGAQGGCAVWALSRASTADRYINLVTFLFFGNTE